tara:strand:+ start:10600 stop:11688 length:1089 start_codon:yes stop_codon:yes gene_type:complete
VWIEDELSYVYSLIIVFNALGLALFNCEAHKYFYKDILDLDSFSYKKNYFKYLEILTSHLFIFLLPLFLFFFFSHNLMLAFLITIILLSDKILDESQRYYIYTKNYYFWIKDSLFRYFLPSLGFIFFLNDFSIICYTFFVFSGALLKINSLKIFNKFFKIINLKKYLNFVFKKHYLLLGFSITGSLTLVLDKLLVEKIFSDSLPEYLLIFQIANMIILLVDYFYLTRMRPIWLHQITFNIQEFKSLSFFSFLPFFVIFSTLYFLNLQDFFNFIEIFNFPLLILVGLSIISYVFYLTLSQQAYWHLSSSMLFKLEFLPFIFYMISLAIIILFFSNSILLVPLALFFYITLKNILYAYKLKNVE